MNSTIAKLADEFEKMEKTIASQKKMIETLMPTGYVDTDTVKLHLNSVYGVMFGGRPSPKRCKLEDCSWDEINMYSSFGLADKMFEVGDTKKFRLADGSYLTARIIGFNHDYGKCKQNGERDWRWERSPFSGSTGYFCSVSSTGSAYFNNASNSLACPSASAFDRVSRKSRPVRGGERSENMNVNRKVGTGFERDLCLSLSGCGFWAHNLAQNSQGQPFDVIAARNGVSYPIDCKDCSKNIFKMERIEENQFSAMTLWKETGNGEGWFAIRLITGEVRFISFSTLLELSVLRTVLSANDIRRYGITLGEWVSQCK